MLVIENLVKDFAGGKREDRAKHVKAIDGVSFAVEPGHLFTLLGPSGCGKTTTLRCVAGLESPDSGAIRVGERVLYSSSDSIKLRANERRLGMMFQSYAIWPHMNVYHNVAFPLEVMKRAQRPSRKEIRERVERVLATVHLDHFADRQATDLSGGQQQRLALARALVMEPSLLLLDEPLSNLDAKLRIDMRHELKRMQRDLGLTTIFVTHDQSEALSMSNRIAVMNGGRIEQIGHPRDVYQRPATRFVADFIGTTNFANGTVNSDGGAGFYGITTVYGELRAHSEEPLSVGASVLLSIRPEQLDLEKGGSNVPQVGKWSGTVLSHAFLGEAVEHRVRAGDLEINVRTNPNRSISTGTEVNILFNETSVSVLPVE